MKRTYLILSTTFALLSLALPAVLAQEKPAETPEPKGPPRVKAVAPPNHLQLKDTASGSYFIAKPLKEEYDRLIDRLRTLQADIESERTSGAEALKSLKTLQTDLAKLRDEIEKKKRFVPIAPTHVQTETITFDLGGEKLLVITADNVRLVGWDGPGVKVELEKTVLSTDGKLDEAELKGLKVIHKQERVPGQVGRTIAENDIEEAKFLESKEGKTLKPEHLAWRKKFHREIEAHYAIYGQFQGKEVDTLAIEGLTHEQGNRQMTLEVESKDGGGSMRSVWRRHARLTVYVPPCQAVAIRGGLEKLEIENVKASLVLTADDSHDRDYHSQSVVRGVTGSLATRNIPLNVIENVSGDVSLTCTVDLANSGTSHGGGSDPEELIRTHHFYQPVACSVKNVGGKLQAWLCRVDLQVQDISGQIDVRNEFGETRLSMGKPLAKAQHRVISEAGRIELKLSPATLGELPLWAVTQCGNVRTNASRELLDSFSYTQAPGSEGVSRGWSGFRRTKKEGAAFDPEEFMESASRADKVLHNEPHSPGIDLISRGGTVVVTVEK